METRVHSFLGLIVATGLVNACAGAAVAEIRNRSAEELAKAAGTIVAGKVSRIYSRTEPRGKYEHTDHIAEIVIDEVRKGQDFKPGDRVYVRYWRKRYVGTGNPEPGHYGHRGVPQEGERGVAYLKGNRSDGCDVLSPNGFSRMPAEASEERSTSRE